jgi:hypothetical protein
MTAGGRCNLELATRRGGRGRSRVVPQLHSLRDNCFSTCSRNKGNVVIICHWQRQENIIKRAHRENKIKTKASWVWSRPRGSPCDLVRRVELDFVVATVHQTWSALAFLVVLVSCRVRGTSVALGRVFDASHRVSLSLGDKGQ